MSLEYIQAVYKSLEQLGSNPDEVAGSLRKLGITGRRNGYATCPLSVFLKQQGYKIEGICVGFDLSEGSVDNPLPPACETFVYAFDSGLYPELELEDKEGKF